MAIVYSKVELHPTRDCQIIYKFSSNAFGAPEFPSLIVSGEQLVMLAIYRPQGAHSSRYKSANPGSSSTARSFGVTAAGGSSNALPLYSRASKGVKKPKDGPRHSSVQVLTTPGHLGRKQILLHFATGRSRPRQPQKRPWCLRRPMSSARSLARRTGAANRTVSDKVRSTKVDRDDTRKVAERGLKRRRRYRSLASAFRRE
jgi:hypothetical protein